MKMSKKQYRIGELAQELKLKKFVLRFWEKELNLTSNRSVGGQRFYQEQDFETFKLIKNLLYDRKFTLAGAKKELELIKNSKKSILASTKTDMNNLTINTSTTSSETMHHKLLGFQQKLKKLQELL